MTDSALPAPKPDDRTELVTIGTVGAAHFGSHFLQLSLAPLLPLIVADQGVSFAMLGWVLTVFYATSGVGQVIAGVLVDRFGPHRLLMGGITLQAVSVVLMGLAPSVWLLFPLAVTAGIGNSVYHPADLSILSHRVRKERLGRGIATHVIGGSAGFAAAPLLIGMAGAAFGWRPALMIAGGVVLVIAAAIAINRRALAVSPADIVRHGGGAAVPRASFLEIVAMPVMLLSFVFFVLSSVAGGAIMNFAESALHDGYMFDLSVANLAVSLALSASIAGTLLSGMYIDRTGAYRRVAVVALLGSAAFYLSASASVLPMAVIMLLMMGGGFLYGAMLPPRDILVRDAAPRGSLGKSFGLVYSGLDVGGVVGPLVLGYLLDHGRAELVFVFAAGALLLALPTVVGAWRMRAAPRPAPAE